MQAGTPKAEEDADAGGPTLPPAATPGTGGKKQSTPATAARPSKRLSPGDLLAQGFGPGKPCRLLRITGDKAGAYGWIDARTLPGFIAAHVDDANLPPGLEAAALRAAAAAHVSASATSGVGLAAPLSAPGGESWELAGGSLRVEAATLVLKPMTKPGVLKGTLSLKLTLAAAAAATDAEPAGGHDAGTLDASSSSSSVGSSSSSAIRSGPSVAFPASPAPVNAPRPEAGVPASPAAASTPGSSEASCATPSSAALQNGSSAATPGGATPGGRGWRVRASLEALPSWLRLGSKEQAAAKAVTKNLRPGAATAMEVPVRLVEGEGISEALRGGQPAAPCTVNCCFQLLVKVSEWQRCSFLCLACTPALHLWCLVLMETAFCARACRSVAAGAAGPAQPCVQVWRTPGDRHRPPGLVPPAAAQRRGD